MSRKFLKSIMPDNATMRDHPHLRRLGQRVLDPQLWYLNRKQVSMGVAVGLFFAFLPIPAQMLVVGILAIWWRFNLPIAVASVWVSNPLTMGPIFYFQYRLGARILDLPIGNHSFELSWQWFQQVFAHIWQPIMVGAVITGLVAALLGVILVRMIWRLMVIYSWLKRRKKNREKEINR